jgi:NAD(P)-dependent dehydrogenase (short-subunit alcohol dehydrogenase family)
MTLFDLSGKTAIVTGATKGIGRAIASRMAEHGANIVVSSRKQDPCDRVARDINENWAKSGNEAAAIPCHISHKEQLQALVDRTVARFGGIDILVCNAAVNPFFGSLRDIPDSAFDRIMETNIRSNHWLCQMASPHIAKRGGGSITIISSVGGLRAGGVLGAYGISKAADMQIARALAVEYGPDNIRVNCIAPGLIRTDFARALWEDEERIKSVNAKTPLGRIGDPDEIAGAAVMLASAAGSFISGETIVIDGGVTISSKA